MCGIFGWITADGADIQRDRYQRGIEKLLLLSETRGKEASGICLVNEKEIAVYKDNSRAKKLIHSAQFHKIMDKDFGKAYRTLMGHARMVTNGTNRFAFNNQPVIKGDLICIHNGIIVNDRQIWDRHPEMTRSFEVDTEVFLSLLQLYDYKKDLRLAFKKSLEEIEGSLSIALLDRTSQYLLLYTNIGSLYTLTAEDHSMVLFASERYILEQMITTEKLTDRFALKDIQQIEPGQERLVDLKTGRMFTFKDWQELKETGVTAETGREFVRYFADEPDHMPVSEMPQMKYTSRYREVERLLSVDESKIRELKRCKRCLLPETFPGISFDEQGVCTVCQNYKKKEVKGEQALQEVLRQNIHGDANYDCIVPLSGGRDSCYLMHYIVRELGLKPVAYTYDWGMVTDLARRNIQRMCSALQVEHILISADITKKRRNVQMNVNAWLKNPNLATVPLFMAGDKQFFYYAQLLKKQMKVSNILFGMNSLEETKFKVAFTGTREKKGKDLYYNMSAGNKAHMFFYYGQQFLKNPSFLNSSLFDTLFGFISYYMLPQDYVQFYDYIKWDQKEIEKVILDEYHWEKAEDTEETWRIGDGTAAFYNYIYYRLAGFTEFDTFKSNQIREGMLDREQALQEVYESNRVRPESFIWYCDTIGIDPVSALKAINKKMPLYERPIH